MARSAKEFRRIARWLPLRRVGVAAMLLAFLAATIGVPVFPARHTKGIANHPCAGKGCGCSSADGCWQSCCCMTLEQRIAWARQNDVPVPPEALARLDEERQTKSCCAAKRSAKPTGDSINSERRRIKWIPAMAGLKCRGLAMSLTGLNVPLTLPPGASNIACEYPAVAILCEPAPTLCSVVHDLPTPYG